MLSQELNMSWNNLPESIALYLLPQHVHQIWTPMPHVVSVVLAALLKHIDRIPSLCWLCYLLLWRSHHSGKIHWSDFKVTLALDSSINLVCDDSLILQVCR